MKKYIQSRCRVFGLHVPVSGGRMMVQSALFLFCAAMITASPAMEVMRDSFSGSAGPVAGSPGEVDLYAGGWKAASTNLSLRYSGDGKLIASADGQYASIQLPRQGPRSIVTIRADYTGTPGNGSWLGFGFTDGVHSLLDSQSGPWVGLTGSGSVKLFGGSGTNNMSSASVSYIGGTVPVELTYDMNTQTATFLFNGQTVFSNAPVVHSVTGGPCIDYLTVYFSTSTATAGHSLDNVRTDLIPRPQPLRGIQAGYTISVPAQGTSNAVPALQVAISNAMLQAAAGKKVVIQLNPGSVYYLGAPGLDTNSVKSWTPATAWLEFTQTSNIWFNGRGATLMNRNFMTRIFNVDECRNIIISDLTADCVQPPFVQGIIQEVGDGAVYGTNTYPYIDLEVDPSFPLPDSTVFSFRDPADSTQKNWFNDSDQSWGYAIDPVINGRCAPDREDHHMHFRTDRKAGQNPTGRVYRILASTNNRYLQPGDRYISQAREGGFCRPFFSSRVTLSNITSYASAGGLFQGQGNNELGLLNCRILIKSGHWKSQNAGVMGSSWARTAPWIENCQFEGVSDDILNNNYYNTFLLPDKTSGNKEFQVRRWDYDSRATLLPQSETTPDDVAAFRVGDRVRFVNGGTGAILAERNVVRVFWTPWFGIEVDATVDSVVLYSTNAPLDLSCTQLKNRSINAGGVVSGCVFTNIRGRVRSGSGFQIYSNAFTGFGRRCISMDADNSLAFSISGCSGEIIIAGNQFRESAYAPDAYGVINSDYFRYTADANAGVRVDGTVYFRDVLITGNRFESWVKPAVSLANAGQVRILGNVFSDPASGASNTVEFLSAEGALLKGNQQSGFPVGMTYLTFDQYSSGITNSDTLFLLTVNNGSGGGSYAGGTQVPILADVPVGYAFDRWTGDTQYVDYVTSPAATITMPAKDAVLTATYVDASSILYSNDYAGTEYKAVGVGAVSYFQATNGSGVLYATAVNSGAGSKVDLNALNLDTDSSVTAVQIDAVMRAPTNNTWIGFGFTDGGTYNLANTGGGKPWLGILQSGIVRLYGGEAASNVIQSAAVAPLSPAVFGLSFTYYVNGADAGKADVVINGSNVWTKQALTFTPTNLPQLNYAHVHLRSMNTASNGDGYVDSFAVKALRPVYTLTVINGSGSGSYTNGQQVAISANAPASGKAFDQWTGDTQYVNNFTYTNAIVTLSTNHIILTATYKDAAVYHLLTANGGVGGSISPTSTNVLAGNSVSFVITASNYYRIATLNTNGTAVTDLTFDNSSTATNFIWSNVQTSGLLAATFTAQVANDPANTPYAWLAQYGLTNYNADANADQDGDGLKAWQEYIAGTDPTNAVSVFKATQNTRNVITWSAVSGRIYSVYWSTNLVKGFQSLETNILYPRNSCTNTTPDSRVNHYQVKVRMQ